MTKLRNNTVLFRSLAVFMSLALAMPSFAAVPSLFGDVSKLLHSMSGGLPPKFSAQPRPRPHRDDLRRDVNRDKWWTPEARQAYEDALIAAHGEPEALAQHIVATLTPGLALAWGSGSTAGYPIPGEGSFPGGGSAKNNDLGVQGTMNSATSNLTIELPIVSIPARGDLEVDFILYHNSQENANNGAVGVGWTHTYSTNIVWTLTHAFVELADGLVIPFTKSGPIYITPVGFFGNSKTR